MENNDMNNNGKHKKDNNKNDDSSKETIKEPIIFMGKGSKERMDNKLQSLSTLFRIHTRPDAMGQDALENISVYLGFCSKAIDFVYKLYERDDKKRENAVSMFNQFLVSLQIQLAIDGLIKMELKDVPPINNDFNITMEQYLDNQIQYLIYSLESVKKNWKSVVNK